MTPRVEKFDSREGAHLALAAAMDDAVRAALADARRPWLCLSGGSSPVALYGHLATSDWPWAQIDVTLSDERWVPGDHPDSNEALLRRTMVTGPATQATVHGLYRNLVTPDEAVPALNEHFASLAQPFDYCLLGMGGDGHTASLFPDASNLQALLQETRPVAAAHVPRLANPRITLSPPRLLASRHIGLLLFGDDKLAVLERALAGDDLAELPVRCVLRQGEVPVTCYWAS
ncbi:MAG: 6-phosphogluconolactonase [Pseudomonadota bacterium]